MRYANLRVQTTLSPKMFQDVTNTVFVQLSQTMLNNLPASLPTCAE